MLSLADLTLWLLTTAVEAFVVYLFLIKGLFRKFLFLNFYLLLSVTVKMGRYASLFLFGFVSSEYWFFFYLTEALLTVFLFLSICELSVLFVGTDMSRSRVLLWSADALLATAWFSFLIASTSGSRVTAHF